MLSMLQKRSRKFRSLNRSGLGHAGQPFQRQVHT
jgi:hypothetical protein